MAIRQGQEFDPSVVGLITLQYKDGENTIDVLDCVGMIQTEPTTRTKTKTCGGATKDERTYTQFLTVNITSYVTVETLQTLTGMTSEGLKDGIKAYGLRSSTPNLVLTARLLDDMARVEKIVAYPNAVYTKGLAYTVDNDSDDVPKVDLSFKAMQDEKGNFYYEQLVTEANASDVEAWEAGFTTALVENVGG